MTPIEHLNEALKLLASSSANLERSHAALIAARRLLSGEALTAADYSREDSTTGAAVPTGVEGTALGRAATGDGA